MGFNLNMFLAELLQILEKDIDEVDMLSELEERIQEGVKYARECGAI